MKIKGISVPYYTDGQLKQDIYAGDVYDTSEERAKLIVEAGYAEYTKEEVNVKWQPKAKVKKETKEEVKEDKEVKEEVKEEAPKKKFSRK